VAIRTEAQIKTALDNRKPGTVGANHSKQERADRAELAVVYRVQQRLHFSRQSTNFASVGEATYY
jgi:hypothetical protein